MKTEEARVTQVELDAIQVARGKVPLMEFRLRTDCAYCLWLMDLPANGESILEVRKHILEEHRDEITPDTLPAG